MARHFISILFTVNIMLLETYVHTPHECMHLGTYFVVPPVLRTTTCMKHTYMYGYQSPRKCLLSLSWQQTCMHSKKFCPKISICYIIGSPVRCVCARVYHQQGVVWMEEKWFVRGGSIKRDLIDAQQMKEASKLAVSNAYNECKYKAWSILGAFTEIYTNDNNYSEKKITVPGEIRVLNTGNMPSTIRTL